ncbi:MAG: pilus assembly protein [bacterium]|nr:pilus assembly protein [bacterium]
MRALHRGTALPETALVIGISLVVVLGAVQAAIVGYSQISTDGAAFVAAHTLALDAAVSAPSVVATALPNFAPDGIVTSAVNGNIEQATVTKRVDGFMMLPGLASSYQLTGADAEFAPSNGQGAAQTFAFAIDAALDNYCPDRGSCGTRAIYLAQSVDTASNANGWNGPFAEWRCHQQYYASVNWPQQRPTTGVIGSAFDPESPGTNEYAIYRWDTGSHACK